MQNSSEDIDWIVQELCMWQICVQQAKKYSNAVGEGAEMNNLVVMDFHPVAGADGL